jgi:translation initiation factor IF-3
MASDKSLDIVEISPNAKPPVCKLMDYGRYKFDQKKKLHQSKAKQTKVQIKEIKFRPGTDIGDYNVKLKHLTKFLEHGDKTKITIRFRGREMAHRELGLELLKRVEDDLSHLAGVESHPKLEGRQMTMVMAPLKKGEKKK